MHSLSIRSSFFLAVPLALVVAGCGSVVPAANGGGSDGGDGGAPHPALKSDFPVGTLSRCTSFLALGGTMGSSVGDGTVTLAEKDGVVSAQLSGGNGLLVTGAVKFQVATSTTAFALPGQSFDPENYVDGAPPRPVSAGTLALVDGNLIVSLAGGAGVSPAWFECVVPYASCDSPSADPSATLPSGVYGSCVTSNGASGPGGTPGTVTLTRTGGTVTAAFSSALVGIVDTTVVGGAFVTSVDFTVVGRGTAISSPVGPATATCGDGTSGLLMVEGDSLFLSGGKDWQVGNITCTATGATQALAPGGGADVPAADGSTLAATETGRTVAACSACKSSEVCVQSTFQGDFCTRPDGGDCPSGTSFNKSANCCSPDPSITYACWPIPPSCTHGLSCDCLSGVVTLACGPEEPQCSMIDGGVACQVASP